MSPDRVERRRTRATEEATLVDPDVLVGLQVSRKSLHKAVFVRDDIIR